jgi:hypothetical protein
MLAVPSEEEALSRMEAKHLVSPAAARGLAFRAARRRAGLGTEDSRTVVEVDPRTEEGAGAGTVAAVVVVEEAAATAADARCDAQVGMLLVAFPVPRVCL